MSIFLTGSSGFVGQNLVTLFKDKEPITKYTRGSMINIQEDSVIHLAGMAHDLKNVYSEDHYYRINTDFTKKVFDAFLDSDAKVFIFLSSVKAVADGVNEELIEDIIPNPITHYGKSKLFAEQYILSKTIPQGKRIYILRPCMIHGPGNKGNLNLLYKMVNTRLPWPLGAFDNQRSYLSIDNLCFIVNELIERKEIPSGVYNVADDIPLSTNEVVRLIAKSKGSSPRFLYFKKPIILAIARIGDILKLPLNTERLLKLTESYIVSNNKILTAIGKKLPFSSENGLIKTFQSFNH